VIKQHIKGAQKGGLVQIAKHLSYYEHLLKVEFPAMSCVPNVSIIGVFKGISMGKTWYEKRTNSRKILEGKNVTCQEGMRVLRLVIERRFQLRALYVLGRWQTNVLRNTCEMTLIEEKRSTRSKASPSAT